MRKLVPALILLLAASPGLAAEHGGHGKGEKGKEDGAPGTNVDMPFLMAPIVGADGNLAGYAYIASRITATSVTATSQVREKIAFIQDAFVRDVNGAAITKPGDPDTLDMPGLEARLLADARRIMGKGAIASLALVQVQIAPLHPQETQAMHPPELPQAQSSPASAPEPPIPAKKHG